MSRAFLKQWAVFSAPLLLALATVWMALPSESATALFFEEHRTAHPGLTLCLKWLSALSNPAFYVYYGALLLRGLRQGDRAGVRAILILLAVQAVIALVAVHFVKRLVGRPRPGQSGLFDPLTNHPAYHSLPSGHTAEITGWALPRVLWSGRFWSGLLLGLLIAGVGVSRVYLGWHYPSDVFFGWLLGSLSGFATVSLVDSTLFRGRGDGG